MAREIKGKIDLKIRKATKKDTRQICGIYITESSKKPYNEKYTLKTALPEFKEFFKKDMHVLTSQKEILGFIVSEINPNEREKANVIEFWIKKEHQRKGYGKELLKFIEEKYKDKGVKKIRLVSKKMSDAFKFYKKLKFKEDTSLCYMEKELK